MAAYRFCRTDDIALLADALNRCWSPHFPDEPAMTPAAFKQSIRERQVWCSSCMVAFAGDYPIGVLIGAKRPSGTLIHRIAVHPDHQRQEHGRHLLASLGSKLAILGPPRTLAEVPEALVPACRLFEASGYVQEALLTDYVLPRPANDTSFAAATTDRFVIPVTVDDLAANGLLREDAHMGCWERSVHALNARKADITGLAIASDECIEAYLLYARSDTKDGGDAPAASQATVGDVDILCLRTCVEDGGGRLRHLLALLCARTAGSLRWPKVHPDEMSQECLDALGFRSAATHRLFATMAGSDQARAN